jgi:pSer/pThr/pTyr-binding forkhead associated (FHA) protein
MMEKPRLIFLSPAPGACAYELSGTVSLGRAADNTVCLEDENVSRYHALIEERGGVFWLSDLGSLRGTTINGAPLLAEQSLRDGDVISLGGTVRLRYSTNGSEPRETTPPNPAGANAQPAPIPPRDFGMPVPTGPIAPEPGLSPLHISAAVTAGLLVFGFIAMIVFRNQIWPGGDDMPPTPGPDLSPTVSVTPGPSETDGAPGLAEIREMTNELAIEIAGVGGALKFAPEVFQQIRAATNEYRLNVLPEAEVYRARIRKAFLSDEGFSATLGFVLAHSRSRFRPGNAVQGCGADLNGVGPYLIPRTVLMKFGQDEASDPDAVRVAAKHLKELMVMDGPEAFVYAVACFGESGERADQIARQSSVEERRNFWALVKKNVVSPEEASRVVCFFAAGVVAENPDRFRLEGVNSLRSIY